MPPLLLSAHNYTVRNIVGGHSILTTSIISAGLEEYPSIRNQDDSLHRLNILVCHGLRTSYDRTRLALVQTSDLIKRAILDPSPLVFFCCTISAAALKTAHGYLNRHDRYQIWFILMGIFGGPVIGLPSGYDLLASALGVMPWTVLGGLLVSDVMSHVLRADRSDLQLMHIVAFGDV